MRTKFREWLWFCAGVDLEIAREVRTERVVLDSLGASVLGTAVLAGLTSSYAAFFVFENTIKAIGFGCLWAALIFNLDRFSVASIRKSGSFAQDLLVALPRMLLALLIAIVIVLPLELRLFEEEIEEKLPEHAVGQLNLYAAAVEQSHLGSTIKQHEHKLKSIKAEFASFKEQRSVSLDKAEVSRIRSDLTKKSEKINKLEDEITREEEKNAKFERLSVDEEEGLLDSKKKGRGPEWRALQARVGQQVKIIQRKQTRLNALRNEVKNMRGRLAEIGEDVRLKQLGEDQRRAEEELKQAYRRKQEDINNHRQRLYEEQASSILTRLTIVHKLTKENPTADWTVALLRLLVVILELAPILLKLMSERGPYDAWRETKAQLEISKAERAKFA